MSTKTVRFKLRTSGNAATVRRAIDELKVIVRAELERVLGTPVAVEVEWTDAQENAADSLDTPMAKNWRWAIKAREAGLLSQYAGKHIVVTGESVIAADRDAEAAVQSALKQTKESRRDLAVLYVDEPGKAGWLDVD